MDIMGMYRLRLMLKEIASSTQPKRHIPHYVIDFYSKLLVHGFVIYISKEKQIIKKRRNPFSSLSDFFSIMQKLHKIISGNHKNSKDSRLHIDELIKLIRAIYSTIALYFLGYLSLFKSGINYKKLMIYITLKRLLLHSIVCPVKEAEHI